MSGQLDSELTMDAGLHPTTKGIPTREALGLHRALRCAAWREPAITRAAGRGVHSRPAPSLQRAIAQDFHGRCGVNGCAGALGVSRSKPSCTVWAARTPSCVKSLPLACPLP